ncbi:MAG: DUF4199 family protein [Melioribacteraceae bacterium]|nr:DUF4199 family protein [Melioribacteraceae bacterium]
MRKYLSTFVAGFGAGVLQIVPVAKSFSCCLIIPVAAYIAIILDRRANNLTGQMKLSKGLILGLLTGLWAALFGSSFEIFITLITKNNDLVVAYPELQKMISEFPLASSMIEQAHEMLSSVVYDIQNSGFSFLYSFAVIANNLVINTIFGIIGGLIGAQIISSKSSNRLE